MLRLLRGLGRKRCLIDRRTHRRLLSVGILPVLWLHILWCDWLILLQHHLAYKVGVNDGLIPGQVWVVEADGLKLAWQ